MTGYQIQYATNSSFKSAKTVTVKGYTTVRKKISSLTRVDMDGLAAVEAECFPSAEAADQAQID